MSPFEDKLKALENQLYEIRSDTKLSNDERQKLLAVVEDAKNQIQTPTEFIWRTFFQVSRLPSLCNHLTWEQPHEFAMIRVATELNLPSILHEHGQSTASDLASRSGAEELLIGLSCHCAWSS